MAEDESLIARAREGDRDALETLVTRYWQPIYRLVYYKVGNPDDAQEITQETFLKTVRSLARYQETGAAFQTYIGRIAMNLVNDFWRKKGRTPPMVDIGEYREPLVDHSERPEEVALHQERRHLMKAMMQKLPPVQRQVIELRILGGLSVREAAVKMNKTEPALKMLQQRALKNLRQYCQDAEREWL